MSPEDSGETPDVVKKVKEDTTVTAPGYKGGVPGKEDVSQKATSTTKAVDPSTAPGQASSGKDVLTSPSRKRKKRSLAETYAAGNQSPLAAGMSLSLSNTFVFIGVLTV